MMMFAVLGLLKQGVEEKLPGLQVAFNEHLAQPFQRIALAGTLLDEERSRRGFLMFLEAENHAQAEAYLQQSPLFRADAYDRVEVAEFAVQVGRLD